MFEEASIIEKRQKSTALFFAKDAEITEDSSREIEGLLEKKRREGKNRKRRCGRFLSFGRPRGRIKDGVLLVASYGTHLLEHDDTHAFSLHVDVVSLCDHR